MWFAERPLLRVGLMEDQLVIDSSVWRGRGELPPLLTLPVGPVHSAQPNWTPVLECLSDWLKQTGVQRPRVHIHLSSCFVRWQLVEWHPKVTHPQELDAYIHMRFRSTFGAVVEHWQMEYAQPQPGHPLAVCAIDKSLLTALVQTQAIGNLHLVGVRPYFSAAFDHWKSRWGNQTAWFGVTEPSIFTLGLIYKGTWRGLRSMRHRAFETESDFKSTLSTLQTQMALSTGLDLPGSTAVFMTGHIPRTGWSEIPGLEWLDSKSKRQPSQGSALMAWGI